jgi:hypothetical protein
MFGAVVRRAHMWSLLIATLHNKDAAPASL